MTVTTIDILLIEDNEADADLTRISLAKSKILDYARLHHVPDGEAALEFLRRAAPVPDLILLDLNLPGMNGSQVLKEIKADPDFRKIPVVILTSSDAHEDIVRSYTHYASGYIRKPGDLGEFAKIAAAIESFWFQVVSLPTQPKA